MRSRDALAAERRRMPWMVVDNEYLFEGPAGPAKLVDLFDGRRQLIVYAPSSSPASTAGPTTPARAARWWPTRSPTSPISTPATPRSFSCPELLRPMSTASRRGWAGHAVVHADRRLRRRLRRRRVARDERIHPRQRQRLRTYFINSRGDEAMGGTWSYLDMTALGRQEVWEDSPEGYPQTRPTSGGTGMTNTGTRDRRTRSGCTESPAPGNRVTT